MRKTLFSLLGAVALAVTSTVVLAPAASAEYSKLCPYTSAQPIVKRGDTGAVVKQVQCELNYSLSGPDLDVDGKFGPATEVQLKWFQGCAGLDQDGIVGDYTWILLNRYSVAPGNVC